MSVVLSVGSTVRPTRAAPAARRCHAILPLIPTRSRAAASAPVHERRLRGTSETFQRCTVAKAAAEDEPVKRNLLFLGLLFTGWCATLDLAQIPSRKHSTIINACQQLLLRSIVASVEHCSAQLIAAR